MNNHISVGLITNNNEQDSSYIVLRVSRDKILKFFR
ncbi:unnamed protein product, partial [Rotaria sordida]